MTGRQTLANPTVKSAPARAPRILYLATGLAMHGGAEVQTADLALRFHKLGWAVSVASILEIEQPVRKLVDAGIPVTSLGLRKGAADPRSLTRFAQLVRREQPDIVHSHMTHANLLARLGRLLAPGPALVCTLHGFRMYTTRGDGWKGRELAHRMTDGLADVTTVVCEAAARVCATSKAVSAGRLRVLVNGIDTDRFRPDANVRVAVRDELRAGNEFLWLAVGRFHGVKDHATLLRAFHQLVAQRPAQRLLLVGTGELEQELRRLAGDLGIAAKVDFLGLRTDVDRLMKGADACVLSSIFEGLPLVLLEAAASGLPAVATRVGGTGEALVDNVTGYLSASRDANALSAAMLRLADLPSEDRRRMGAAARRHAVSRFRVETVVKQWTDLYEEVLRRREKRG